MQFFFEVLKLNSFHQQISYKTWKSTSNSNINIMLLYVELEFVSPTKRLKTPLYAWTLFTLCRQTKFVSFLLYGIVLATHKGRAQ